MKIYLAARYSRKQEMMRLAETLRENAIEVTSSWLDEPFAPDTLLNEVSPRLNMEYALTDLRDIDRADTVLFFSEDPLVGTPRGGRHVEFGYAVAKGKRVVVIGQPENVFHYLPAIIMYQSVQQFLDSEEIVNEPVAD